MKVSVSNIPDVLVVEPDVFEDDRGLFMELFHDLRYREFGITEKFVQDNYSVSCQNTLRGLHYQLDSPQGKLVQVIEGEVFDVAVDVRIGSPSFGQWVGEILSDGNNKQLYIPPGFAHGFCVMSQKARFIYKCTSHYDSSDEYGLFWADKTINIDWPVQSPRLSEKDQRLPTIDTISREILPVYSKS